jgi:GT2 family glycosyltransferase
MEKKIAVIIVNYVSYEDTISYVQLLLIQKNVSLEIIVVDNASPNNSLTHLVESFDSVSNVTVLESKINGGYAQGNNTGLEFIAKMGIELIIISNNDVSFDDPFFLSKWVDSHLKLPKIAFSAPMMMVNGAPSKYSAWKIPSVSASCISTCRLLETTLGDKKKYLNITHADNDMVIECLPGSLFMGSRKAFDSTNNFDHNTFLYMEEVILARKIKDLGLNNYLIPSLKYEHYVSKTISSQLSLIKMRMFMTESVIYYHKNYDNTSKYFLLVIQYLSLIWNVETKCICFVKKFFNKN